MKHDIEPFVIEVADGDSPYMEGAATSVAPTEDGWVVEVEGWTAFVPAVEVRANDTVLRPPVEPRVGDRIALYGRGIGYEIEGIVVNDAVVYYRTPGMREAHRRRWLEDLDARKQREFTLLREEMDKEYAALPAIFQARIDRFRDKDPEFRRDSERYEVFCCSEAVKVADHCAERRPDDPRGYFREMVTQGKPEGSIDPWWGQLTEAGVVSEGHSNNTFSGALRLADALMRSRAGEEVSA